METYIGKICPFCKTEIKEGDAVKVCPACNIPHHESCWEENKGCTTFGCSEQHYEAQHTNPTDVCQNCGAPLGDGQAFCPKCGTPKNAPSSSVCGKCGAELQEGQVFCSNCGHKVGALLDSEARTRIEQYNANIIPNVAAKKKVPKKLTIIIAACVTVLIAFLMINSVQKNNLHKHLQSTKWWTYDEDTLLYLDFSDDEIEYSGSFGILGERDIATLDYKVIDGNTIKVNGREISVEVDDESIVFRPSFINSDSFSLWME